MELLGIKLIQKPKKNVISEMKIRPVFLIVLKLLIEIIKNSFIELKEMYK